MNMYYIFCFEMYIVYGCKYLRINMFQYQKGIDSSVPSDYKTNFDLDEAEQDKMQNFDPTKIW